MSEMVMSGLGNPQLQPSGIRSDLDKLLKGTAQDKTRNTFTCMNSLSAGSYYTEHYSGRAVFPSLKP